MLALFCLVTIGAAIVFGRLFHNGSREARTAPAETTVIPEEPVRQRRRKATTAPAARATPPATQRWPGGRCPACGAETVPGAKYCGECGNRLAS